MTRILIGLLALVLLVSCGKGGEEGADTASVKEGQPAQGATDQPVERIPDEEQLTELEQLADARLSVYFDEEGTDRDTTVAPGEFFDIYVFGEFSEALTMQVAQYKMVIPEGVTVMGTKNTDGVAMTVGTHERDFIISFDCFSGPKGFLVKYLCRADDDFNGGRVELVKGDAHNYLGFCLCDDQKTLIRARGSHGSLRRR